MNYKNIVVNIPSKCIIYPNGLVYYSVKKEYKSDKKYNVYKRVCVGKTIDDKTMNPNDNYESYFSSEEFKKEPPILSDCVSVGLTSVIDKLLDNLQVDDILKEYYEDDEYSLIRDLIVYMIYNESTIIQHFPSIMRRMDVLSNTLRSDSYISGFFKDNITDKKIEQFLNDYNALERDKDILYISYDSTNMNCHSSGIELAEYGHAKDDEGLPQVNLSLAINQKEDLPLFYELYPGSIIDNSQLKHMVDRLKEYGYKDIGVILDRGYFSKFNIDYLNKNGYNYLLMVKTNNDKIKELIDKYELSIYSDKYFIDEHNVYGVSEKVKLYSKDKKKVFIHLYFDPERAASDKKGLSRTRIVFSNELDEHIKTHHKKADLTEKYGKMFYLKEDEDGYLISYKVNENYMKETSKEYGFFSIVTSSEMDASKALETYRQRDSVEKLFRSLKSDMDYTKYRIHSSSSLKGKTFITFLATIIRSQILHKTKSLRKSNRKDYTVNSIINELSNIEVTKNSKDVYVRRYSLTSKQKNILSKFNLSEKDIDLNTNSLNNKTMA